MHEPSRAFHHSRALIFSHVTSNFVVVCNALQSKMYGETNLLIIALLSGQILTKLVSIESSCRVHHKISDLPHPTHGSLSCYGSRKWWWSFTVKSLELLLMQVIRAYCRVYYSCFDISCWQWKSTSEAVSSLQLQRPYPLCNSSFIANKAWSEPELRKM